MSPSNSAGPIGVGEAGAAEAQAKIDGVIAVEPTPVQYPPCGLLLVLRAPITDAKSGDRFDSLRLEEPTDQQWSDIYDQPADTRRRYAISLIAKVPMSVVAQLKISDIVRAETYIWDFFATAQTDRPW